MLENFTRLGVRLFVRGAPAFDPGRHLSGIATHRGIGGRALTASQLRLLLGGKAKFCRVLIEAVALVTVLLCRFRVHVMIISRWA
jgi:hypothetical protein